MYVNENDPFYSVTGIEVYSLVNLSADVVIDDEKGYGKQGFFVQK